MYRPAHRTSWDALFFLLRSNVAFYTFFAERVASDCQYKSCVDHTAFSIPWAQLYHVFFLLATKATLDTLQEVFFSKKFFQVTKFVVHWQSIGWLGLRLSPVKKIHGLHSKLCAPLNPIPKHERNGEGNQAGQRNSRILWESEFCVASSPKGEHQKRASTDETGEEGELVQK